MQLLILSKFLQSGFVLDLVDDSYICQRFGCYLTDNRESTKPMMTPFCSICMFHVNQGSLIIFICHLHSNTKSRSRWRHQMETLHFPCYWPFVRGIHRSAANSHHTGQWRGALVFSLICVWTNGWINNRDAGYNGHHSAHYDVSVMMRWIFQQFFPDIWKNDNMLNTRWVGSSAVSCSNFSREQFV